MGCFAKTLPYRVDRRGEKPIRTLSAQGEKNADKKQNICRPKAGGSETLPYLTGGAKRRKMNRLRSFQLDRTVV